MWNYLGYTPRICLNEVLAMKTFRFTVPQPRASAAERINHRRYREQRNLPPREDKQPREHSPGGTALLFLIASVMMFRLASSTASQVIFSYAIVMGAVGIYHLFSWVRLRHLPRSKWPSDILPPEVAELPLTTLDKAVIQFAPVGVFIVTYKLLSLILPTDGALGLFRDAIIICGAFVATMYSSKQLSRYINRQHWVRIYGSETPMPTV